MEDLKFGRIFNQDLGESLKNLKKLKILFLGKEIYSDREDNMALREDEDSGEDGDNWRSGTRTLEGFNKPLGNSLKYLVNLETLALGKFFEQPLEYSLNLPNLISLDLGVYFNLPLEDSLKYLVNLRLLMFSNNFDQPLGDSLKYLTCLEFLEFGNRFNQPLGDSLDLPNLKKLTFGETFDQELGDSFKCLLKLTHLAFGMRFDRNLGDSLRYLVNLEELKLGNAFEDDNSLYYDANYNNYPLCDSLNYLKKLKKLELGYRYNHSLEGSLDLPNLEEIAFGEKFNQPLGNSLKSLVNLKIIDFGVSFFDQKLGDSLDIPNLEELLFNPDKDYINLDLPNSLNCVPKLKLLFLHRTSILTERDKQQILQILPNLIIE